MTRGEAIKDYFCKTLLSMAAIVLLYCIFRSACVKNGELDYLWLWILCGLPLGIWRLRLWIMPSGGSLTGGIALFILNFILVGIIGAFILVWRLIVAVRYIYSYFQVVWHKNKGISNNAIVAYALFLLYSCLRYGYIFAIIIMYDCGYGINRIFFCEPIENIDKEFNEC